MKKLSIACIVVVILWLSCTSFLWFPFWPLRFSERPMFHHWVGASHTAWGENEIMHDQFGTWGFFDSEFNIVVIVFTDKSISSIPLLNANSATATFGTQMGKVEVTSTERNNLVVITRAGDKRLFMLLPLFEGEMRRELIKYVEEAKKPYCVAERLGDIYEGPEEKELKQMIRRELGKVEIPKEKGP